jgi:hypothetical protein
MILKDIFIILKTGYNYTFRLPENLKYAESQGDTLPERYSALHKSIFYLFMVWY